MGIRPVLKNDVAGALHPMPFRESGTVTLPDLAVASTAPPLDGLTLA